MQQPSPPKWINRLYWAALLTALAASLTAAVIGPRSGYDHHRGPVADITVNLNGQPVREHCTSCHLEGGRAIQVQEGDAPSPHPDIAPHSPELLGCTACHLGEGMALDTTISHGLPGLGARQILKGRDLQASCYTCHELAPLKGAARAWRGFQRFNRSACDTCHTVDGIGVSGRYGPDLSHIGSTLGLSRIQEAIREPRKEPAGSTMPRFPLSRGQVKDISFFLKSRVRAPFYATPMEILTGRVSAPAQEQPPADLTTGPPEDLLRQSKCLACHQYKEEDGRIGPDLTFIGQMRSQQYIRDFLTNPSRRIPGATMPRVPLPPAREQSLVNLLSDTQAGLEKRAPKHLYMRLCQRCHAAAGDGMGLIQPNLANFPRAFAGNSEFFRSIADSRIVASVEQGVPGTSMPPYARVISKEETDALLDLIFSAFVGTSRQDKIEQAEVPPLPALEMDAPQGTRLFNRRCARCHGLSGTGRGPDHLSHLPRPRNLTNALYFADLDDKRIARTILDGIAGTAMPAFRDALDARELWALVVSVRNLSRPHNDDH